MFITAKSGVQTHTVLRAMVEKYLNWELKNISRPQKSSTVILFLDLFKDVAKCL